MNVNVSWYCFMSKDISAVIQSVVLLTINYIKTHWGSYINVEIVTSILKEN